MGWGPEPIARLTQDATAAARLLGHVMDECRALGMPTSPVLAEAAVQLWALADPELADPEKDKTGVRWAIEGVRDALFRASTCGSDGIADTRIRATSSTIEADMERRAVLAGLTALVSGAAAGRFTGHRLAPAEAMRTTQALRQLVFGGVARDQLAPLARHGGRIEHAASTARSARERTALLIAYGDALTALAWAAHDARDADLARRAAIGAIHAADEAQAPELAAYGWAQVAMFNAHHHREWPGAQRAVERSLTLAQHSTHAIQAWVYCAAAGVAGMRGDEPAALRALDLAHVHMEQAAQTPQAPQWVSGFDAAMVKGFDGAVAMRLGRKRDAENALHAALDLFPPAHAHRATIYADLARLHSKSYEDDQACELAHQALDAIEQHRSSAKLERLTEGLAPLFEVHRHERAVRELSDRMSVVRAKL
jgi:hypothetical protein